MVGLVSHGESSFLALFMVCVYLRTYTSFLKIKSENTVAIMVSNGKIISWLYSCYVCLHKNMWLLLKLKIKTQLPPQIFLI